MDSRSGEKGYCALITLSFFNLHSSIYILHFSFAALLPSPEGGVGGRLSNPLTTVWRQSEGALTFKSGAKIRQRHCGLRIGAENFEKKIRACEFVTGDFVTISTCHTAETGIIRFMIIYNIIIKILLQLFPHFSTTLMSQRHMSQCLICSTTRRMAPKRVFFSKRVH